MDTPPEFDPATMIPVSEVKVGMRGIGKSVFKGVEITDFAVEVVGILPKQDLGGDMVLVRVLDGPVVERECGIIGGMSGSPVYLEGRLLGAIAYSWPYEKEPIGGVVPMASMLTAYVDPADAKKGAETASHEPVSLHGRRLTSARIAPNGETEPFADATTINLEPVGLMTCSGLSRRVMDDLGDFLAPYDIRAVAGPGTVDEVVPADLVPGAAIAVELMRGDFTATLLGTVTWREGDTLLAFGHPFMQLGGVDMPMSTGFVHEFIPAYSRTDKIGSAMEIQGALRWDGTWSVGGLVGPVPEMIPVDVNVMDETTGKRRSFQMEVARDKNLSQQLVNMAVGDAVDSHFRPIGEGMARVRFTVEGDRGAKIERENVYWSRGSIAMACTREVSSTLYVLSRNPYDPQQPARVTMDVTLSEENISAAIEKVYTDETVAKAGEKVTVHVVLRPWDGEPFEKLVELAMPEDLKRGTMRIGVCGGESAVMTRTRLGLLQPEFNDLPSIIEDIKKTEFNNQLFVGAALPNTGIGVAEHLLHRLPSSISSIMANSRTTDVRGGREEASVLLDTEYYLLGTQYLTLGTEDKSGARASTPPPSTPSSGGPTPPSSPPVRTSAQGSSERPNILTAAPLDWATDLLARAWPGERVAAGDAPPRPEVPTPKPPKKASGKKPDAETPPEKKDEDDKGALTRKLSEWRQTTESDLKQGEPKGLAIRNDGALYVADKKGKSWRTEEQRGVWSVAATADGTTYFGTGKDGRVYKVVGDGEPELLCETGELGVHALALSGGQLYAGTIPNGKLYKLDPASAAEAQPIADLDDEYIWALLPAADGVYAGTGPRGRLYNVTVAGEAKLVADLPAQHVLCLAKLGDDLLAGTSENGIVYRVEPGGEFEAIYDDEDPAVTGVAVVATGEVYACTAPKGHVVRITPGKPQSQVLELKDQAAVSMVAVGDAAYVGTTDDGKIVAVLDSETHAVVAETEASEVSCLAYAGTRLLVGAANPGRVTAFDTAAANKGTLESALLDAERAARWASVLWTGSLPDGGTVGVRTRVGATDDPDDGTWSPWSYSYAMGEVSKPSGEPVRYLQFQVEIEKADNGVSPVFDSFLLRYLPANQRPTLTAKEPLGGAAISGKSALKWEGKDADDDKLRYAVHVKREGTEEWKLLKEDLEEQQYEWDTSSDEVEEGRYSVRVVASDAVSNPDDPLTREVVVRPVVVDNTEPELVEKSEVKVGDDRTVTLTARGLDELSRIVSIEYRIGDEGPWKTIGAADGLLDGKSEAFELKTEALEPGQKVITLRVRDAAGNKHDETFPAAIPGEEEKKDGDEEGKDDKKPEATKED